MRSFSPVPTDATDDGIPVPMSEHAKREKAATQAIDELTRAYNQKDDVLFECAIKNIRDTLRG